jgi:hypothetical protein
MVSSPTFGLNNYKSDTQSIVHDSVMFQSRVFTRAGDEDVDFLYLTDFAQSNRASQN